MSAYFDQFRKTFREVHSTSKKLVLRSLSANDRHLRELMSFVLAYHKPSDYSHVFKYSFCRTDTDSKTMVKLAAAVHLLQSSAFLTDDIFDGTTIRYGQPAVHKKYGISYAVIATELLQTIALEAISAELQHGNFKNKCQVLRIFNQMMRELYVGQYLDIYNTGNLRFGRREYYRVIALGVGNFLAHIAQCGALLAGRPDSEVRKLSIFGYHYGMALFITDDMVDVIDRPDVTGKTYATDLKNRRMRLPIILALQMGGHKDVRFLKGLFRKRKLGNADVEQARRVILRTGALDTCLQIAKKHLAHSVRTLSGMKESPTTENLRWLSETLLTAQRLAQNKGTTGGQGTTAMRTP